MSPRPRSRSSLPNDRAPSRSRSRTRDSRPRSITRSPSLNTGRYDRRTRSRSRSRSSSRGPGKGGRRYRSRSYSRSRSLSRDRSPPRSAKVTNSERQIVVEKLTKNVTEAHLREIFGAFGDIEKLELPMNPAFMTNRGTAYILYFDPADAEAAIAHMHEAQLDGTFLNVSIILPRRNFSRSPPPSTRGNGRRKGPYVSPPREDRVVHDLPRDMIRTDHHRSHARVRDRDHDHHDEGVLVRKAPVSTDDEALVTVVTATVTGAGVGAPTGAVAEIVIKKNWVVRHAVLKTK
ncbi:hypothetical protein N7507_005549 [Penicillium longicatenatum]|nr:hypothetical protein N7507_005549 [Penicillium longicatenatum]